jgi:hypothetical protein
MTATLPTPAVPDVEPVCGWCSQPGDRHRGPLMPYVDADGSELICGLDAMALIGRGQQRYALVVLDTTDEVTA